MLMSGIFLDLSPLIRNLGNVFMDIVVSDVEDNDSSTQFSETETSCSRSDIPFFLCVHLCSVSYTNAATLTPLWNTGHVVLRKLNKYYPGFLLLSIRACPNPGYKFIGRRHFCVVVVLGLNCNRENGSTGKVRRNARIYLTSGTGLKHRLFSDLGSFKFNVNRSM